MAKLSKSQRTDRQKVIDDIRRQQKRSANRQGTLIVTVCVIIAVGIIGAAAYKPIKDWANNQKYKGKSLSEIGAPASVCQPVVTRTASAAQQHVPEGTTVTYDYAPPAYGKHWNVAGVAPVPMDQRFYSTSDRPHLEQLVHNLEHGFTILWYDDTIAEDSEAMTELRAIARKFSDTSDRRNAFIIAPWTSEDEGGKGFPDGQHLALTHWSAGGAGETDTTKQVGVWQYCSDVSGEAVDAFITDYPQLDSPEPSVAF